MNAISAGSRYHVTGGKFLDSDDFLILQARKKRIIEVSKLVGTRKSWLEDSKQDEEYKRVIEFYKISKQKDIYKIDGTKNIRVKDLKTLYR